MKISLYVPKEQNENDVRNFLRQEIAQARNIKSKQTRSSVVAGLQKILAVVMPGHAYFSDGSELIVEEYDGLRKKYYCGNSYERMEVVSYDPYLIVVVDASEAAIGTTDGDRVKVLWNESSMVPKKHRAGGQSQRRFERDRERALKGWLRMVADKVKDLEDGRDIIVGGPGMTKDKFVKELPT